MSTDQLSFLAITAGEETHAAVICGHDDIYRRVLREFDKGVIVKMLHLKGGSISASAETLEITTTTLAKKIDALGLRHLCTSTGEQNKRHLALKRAARKAKQGAHA